MYIQIYGNSVFFFMTFQTEEVTNITGLQIL